jgi:hypothetical protein
MRFGGDWNWYSVAGFGIRRVETLGSVISVFHSYDTKICMFIVLYAEPFYSNTDVLYTNSVLPRSCSVSVSVDNDIQPVFMVTVLEQRNFECQFSPGLSLVKCLRPTHTLANLLTLARTITPNS